MILHNENVKQVFLHAKYMINDKILNILLTLQCIHDLKVEVYA